MTASGRFAPGHLGELTRIVPFEMVDAALAAGGAVQTRVRLLPSRVVVYLLLAAVLFADVGYGQVWSHLVAGLGPRWRARSARPTSSALAQARRRVGAAPLAALFTLLAGPAASSARAAVRWRGRLVTGIDGTCLCVPDSAANATRFTHGGGPHGGTGYPMLRVVTVVACGTRSLIDAAFGPTTTGELGYAHRLLRALGPGMVVLADRNFAAATWVQAVAATGADLLVRVKSSRRLPVTTRLPDGSYLSRIAGLDVRVIDAVITLATTSTTGSTGCYRLVSTITDPGVPAVELVELYHQRWEVETAYAEAKCTTLDGRVLRARTPGGLEQEVYALLVAYQVLRTAIADALLDAPDIDPDRASFTIALTTARDQVVLAAGILDDPHHAGDVDLVGVIGAALRTDLLPPRRLRYGPRVVKRAISKYVAKTATGRLHAPSRDATLHITIDVTDVPLTPAGQS